MSDELSQDATHARSIIGKWIVVYCSIPERAVREDLHHHPVEYTTDGKYVRLFEHEGILRPYAEKCRYEDGQVTHLYPSGNEVVYRYHIDQEDRLQITSPRGDRWTYHRFADTLAP